jgi:hypothetical protein
VTPEERQVKISAHQGAGFCPLCQTSSPCDTVLALKDADSLTAALAAAERTAIQQVMKILKEQEERFLSVAKMSNPTVVPLLRTTFEELFTAVRDSVVSES